jgi:hypothetical protein
MKRAIGKHKTLQGLISLVDVNRYSLGREESLLLEWKSIIMPRCLIGRRVLQRRCGSSIESDGAPPDIRYPGHCSFRNVTQRHQALFGLGALFRPLFRQIESFGTGDKRDGPARGRQR